MKANMSSALAIGLGLALGSGAGAFAKDDLDAPHSVTHVPAAQSSVSAKPAPVKGLEGAADSQLEIQLEPSAVVKDQTGREQLHFDVLIKNKFGKAATVQYKTQIVDDRGHSVVGAAASPLLSSKQQDDLAPGALATPAGLADGFYQIRVTAVGSDGTNSTAAILEKPIHVVGGRVTPISEAEWFSSSNANQAQ